jgi:Protein of unknown function (DUF3800)
MVMIVLGRKGWLEGQRYFVKRLRRGLPSRLWRERLLMPVRVFADDSGSGGESPYFVLGGYMADFLTWERFSDRWDATLAEAPAIDYFKMSEAESLRGQFARENGWTDRTRDQKVNALIDVILEHDVFQSTCAVSEDDYRDVVKPVLGHQFKKQYRDPYLYLFTAAVAAFSSWEHKYEHALRDASDGRLVLFDSEARSRQRIDFVFDRGKKLTDKEAAKSYESLRNLEPYHRLLGRVDFENDKEFVPLQAADLAAWQRRRKLCVSSEGTRPEYNRLNHRMDRFKHHIVSRSDLQATVDVILKRVREGSLS